jgi:UDPglucose 6-dehydrogenase
MVYALGLDSRIGHSHTEVPGYDGKLGWGGHCFPKDTAAFVYFAERQYTDLPLIRKVRELNKIQRK